VGAVVSRLKQDYPGKNVMLFETAYGWTTQNADAATNILFNTGPGYAPLSPENQKRWMIDLTQTVIVHGGSVIVYWEPGWLSIGCSTQWVQGSSWDNATFFDFNNEVQEEGGIGWMGHMYDFTLSAEDPSPVSDSISFQYRDGGIMITVPDNAWLSNHADLECLVCLGD
jgi:arabinogalactan endo-1,4-beta-galactosidase